MSRIHAPMSSTNGLPTTGPLSESPMTRRYALLQRTSLSSLSNTLRANLREKVTLRDYGTNQAGRDWHERWRT